MECERCDELELRYSKRTEKYIGLIESQNRMFRNSEAQAGRDLDAKINEAMASRQEALRELNLHAKSHEN
jgi:hypothetical protein